VTGSTRFSSPQIAPFTGMNVGQSVQRETFQHAADSLAALGCFSSVRYSFSTQGDNVSVEFQVADGPSVPVSFDNFPWLADADIVAALKSDIGLFDGAAAPLQGTLLGMIGDTLAKLLAARNVKGSIEYKLQAAPDSDQQVMQFRIAGPSLPIAGVQFSDALARGDARIQQRLPDVVGKPYSRYTLEVFNVEQVRPVYLRHGFLHVHFDPVQAHIMDAKQPASDSVTVTDSIAPGQAYTWGGAKWSDNSAFSAPQLDALLPLHHDDPADGLKISAGWDGVRAQYGAAGYLDAIIEPVEAFDDEHNRAAYFVKITEGPQYRMGDLILTGVSLAAERRIRAAWKILTGQPFDLGYFNEFLATGARQALAPLPVHIDQIGHFLRTNPQTATVDVLLDFQ